MTPLFLQLLTGCQHGVPADTDIPSPMTPIPMPVLEFPDFDPFDPMCATVADPAALSCTIAEGWDLGAGWCPTEFVAEIMSVAPIDELTIRYEAEYGDGGLASAGIEVFYEGPIDSSTFLSSSASFSPDSCSSHRVVVAHGTACAVCWHVTCLGELFAPVDPDGDGWTSYEDCDICEPTIYPGAPDPPGDGIDQDCDGEN